MKEFTRNLLKENPEKSHILTSTTGKIQINIAIMVVFNSKASVLLQCNCLDNSQPKIKEPSKSRSEKALTKLTGKDYRNNSIQEFVKIES